MRDRKPACAVTGAPISCAQAVDGENAYVKFGVMFQLSTPRPWTRESERTAINNALEQVKLAD